jgi:predicted flap endonuclease-1-like 5' DNA nuclease
MEIAILIITGIIIGFLAEWIVDWLYWRKKAQALESQLEALQKEEMNLENQVNALLEENQHLRNLYGVGTGEAVTTDEDEEVEGEQQELPAFIGEEEDQEVGDIEESEIATESESEAEADIETDVEYVNAKEMPKFKADIGTVAVIDAASQEKLKAIGIGTPLTLIERGSTAKGRAKIAEESGLRKSQVLEWVNFVELYEIKGIEPAHAQLLKACGVNTVVQLAKSDPEQLAQKMSEMNKDQQLLDTPPTKEQIENWINEAGQLPSVATYQAVQGKREA